MILKDVLKKFTESDDQRTQKAKKNIIASVIVKIGSIIISFALVPLTLGYLNKYEYGVWLTLSSVLMWINYFDIGLGNGLRNKLAEALAVNDREKGCIYVSTTFFLLLFIMIGIYLLFLVAQHWLDWCQILNVEGMMVSTDLNALVTIVFAFFCISFVLKIVGNIYLADQMPVFNDLLVFLGNLLSLIVIWILTRTTDGNLKNVAIVFSVSPVIVYSIVCLITFRFPRYKDLAPRISAVKFKYAKDLMGLGVQFFIIQIACLLIFSTSNLIISHVCSPEDVTPYNIAYKYFSIITMGFNILISPFWSAITDAYVKGDFEWIKRTVKYMIKIWGVCVFISMFMLLFSNSFYYFWIGENITISLFLSLFVAIYVNISTWTGIWASFVNGVGKIRIQLYCAVFAAMIFVPMAYGFGQLWGINGICLAMSVSLLPYALLLPIQYGKIMNKKANNFWNH